MRRRDFCGLVGIATASPFVPRAQSQKKLYRIVSVHNAPVEKYPDLPTYRAFYNELRRLGYVEGVNLFIERRSSMIRPQSVSELAREIVNLDPDVIVTSSTNMALALKSTTSTIPIIAYSANSLGSGLIPDLAHPDRNVTGFGAGGIELVRKYFELLKEIDPTISRVGFLTEDDPFGPGSGEAHAKIIQQAFALDGIATVGEHLVSPYPGSEYRRIITAMVQDGAKALIVDGTAANFNNASIIVSLADANRLPIISGFLQLARLGGLASYCPDEEDNYRQIAMYVDKILRGKKPAELPFQQPTRFKLIINMNAAKRLDLTIPPSLLARADEVIE